MLGLPLDIVSFDLNQQAFCDVAVFSYSTELEKMRSLVFAQ